MKFSERIARTARRNLRGLWRLPDFRRLWLSLTITAFGAQVTNLALPLTAALLLHATPLQMGILVALETLPFALVSLHAGVLLDRVRKLPIIITSDVSRGLALLSIPLCAWFGALSIDVLYAVGFFCGVQNVVGGAAYQVLIAQMAGRDRLVEANAKITLGETSSALIGPGIAGALIQMLTAPFAIVVDAVTFLGSALMLRRLRVPNDVPSASVRQSMGVEIREGLSLVWNNPTLRSLALVAGAWQILHHMQVAVLILFATRELGLSAGEIGLAFVFGGLGCVLASAFAQRLSTRRSADRLRPAADCVRLAGVRDDPRLDDLRDGGAGRWHAAVRLRRRAVGDQLPVAAPGDHARPAAGADDGDDALPCHRRGAARLARRRRAGDADWTTRDAVGRRRAGVDPQRRGDALVTGATASAFARRCGRLGPVNKP